MGAQPAIANNVVHLKKEHDFHDSLNRTLDVPDEYWKKIYKAKFPNMLEMLTISDLSSQFSGVDRCIVMNDASTILIDEKIRFEDYGDIALEYVSNTTTKTPGWVCKKLRANYIAYLIKPSGRCFFLPVIELQQAWERRRESWIKMYGSKPVPNAGYKTLICPVPVDVVYQSIGRSNRFIDASK